MEMADKMLKTVKARRIRYVPLSTLSYHHHMIYFFFLLHTLGLITIPALTGTWLLTDSIHSTVSIIATSLRKGLSSSWMQCERTRT